MPVLAPLLLSVSALAGCARGGQPGAPSLPRPGDDGVTLVVEGLANGGFELLADGTTDPPKYGAYWVGAFSPRPGDPADLVEQGDDAARGTRWLALAPGEGGEGGEVHQKIAADPRWTDRLVVSLAWRGRDDAAPLLTLEDGPGRRVSLRAPAPAPDAHGWREVRLKLGAAFAAEQHRFAVPRLHLILEATDAPVQIDDVSAQVWLPAVDASAAAARIEQQVHDTLVLWVEPPGRGGLGLVDRATGYVTAAGFDVNTGGDPLPNPIRQLHSLYDLMARWIRYCDGTGRSTEAARWRVPLQRFVRTLLVHNFDPDTGLPRNVHVDDGPLQHGAVTVGAFTEFLMEARDALDDATLEEACSRQVRRVGDALVALQKRHDLDPVKHPNSAHYDKGSGRFVGSHENWYGHMPNRLTPLGEIDPPRRFNTSWAIVTGRSFWYHLLRSPAAVVAAHEVAARPGDLPAVERALSRYHRNWDASRYDLENDTDDHYGYLCEDLHTLLRHGGAVVPRAIELLQGATDHRLARDVTDAGDTLWIQAIRLGTPCAGDSPRAFAGLLDLYQLGPEVNPVSSGLPLYRQALLELAANDWKGRQLTNGQFTESFFARWEMVCICFKGTYQGDCRERPKDEWDGDVGDVFGGPPRQGINAQVWAYQVADARQRREILARLGTLAYVTETALRRPYGYLAGLDPAIAAQYELPERYRTGLSRRNAAALGTVSAWMTLLPLLREAH